MLWPVIESLLPTVGVGVGPVNKEKASYPKKVSGSHTALLSCPPKLSVMYI